MTPDEALASLTADHKAGLSSASLRAGLTVAAELIRLRRNHAFLRRMLDDICKASAPEIAAMLIRGAQHYLAGTDAEGRDLRDGI